MFDAPSDRAVAAKHDAVRSGMLRSRKKAGSMGSLS